MKKIRRKIHAQSLNTLLFLLSFSSLAFTDINTQPHLTPHSSSSSQPKVEKNTVNFDFSKTKKATAKIHESLKARTIYCDCSYTGKKLNTQSCGFKSKERTQSAKTVNWEHIVPVSVYGRFFSEWKEGHPNCVKKSGKRYRGRKCAGRVNNEFKLMQSDMYNLYPSIMEVNDDRSNYPMAEIEGEIREYGQCDVEIVNQKVEPREEVKGDIARVYMYMDTTYPHFEIINEQNRILMEKWNQNDPISEDECLRYKALKKIQKNKNIILEEPCSSK